MLDSGVRDCNQIRQNCPFMTLAPSKKPYLKYPVLRAPLKDILRYDWSREKMHNLSVLKFRQRRKSRLSSPVFYEMEIRYVWWCLFETFEFWRTAILFYRPSISSASSDHLIIHPFLLGKNTESLDKVPISLSICLKEVFAYNQLIGRCDASQLSDCLICFPLASSMCIQSLATSLVTHWWLDQAQTRSRLPVPKYTKIQVNNYT